MPFDASSVTLLHFGVILNLIGLGVPLAVSLAVVFYHREAFFRHWTVSYFVFFVAILMSMLMDRSGETLLLALAIIACHLVGTTFLLMVGYDLRGNAPHKGVFYGAISAVFLQGTVLLALGKPLEIAVALTLLINLYAHLQLGWVLLMHQKESRTLTRSWLGTASILTGLWGLAYPPMVQMSITWAGYMIAGMLHLLVGIGMVILLLERTSNRLKLQNEELSKLDMQKSNFISTVNHELRTPLTVIKASLSVIRDQVVGPLNDRQYGMMDTVIRHVDELARLINDILDFSKIEGGNMTYAYREGDLSLLATQVVDRLQPLFSKKQLTVAVDVPADPVRAVFDHDRIGQVLTNLLSNAYKFTPEGGCIVVCIRKQNDQVRIEVNDTGIGIATENLERVFSKFYQEDGTLTRRASGTGLGLAICKAIVEDGHSGRIWAESAPGKGCSVIAAIPAGRKAVEAVVSMAKDGAELGNVGLS